MNNKLMKVNEKTHSMIQNIAAQTGDNMIQTIEKAIRLYDKEIFWREYDKSLKRLSKEELDDYRNESKSMDGSLKDGLDD